MRCALCVTCGATLSAGSTCVLAAQYLPTAITGATVETATLTLGLPGAAASTTQTVALTGSSLALAGTVTPTSNPQVALYTMVLPSAGSITVNFGTGTSYGRQTWTQSTTTAGPVRCALELPDRERRRLRG